MSRRIVHVRMAPKRNLRVVLPNTLHNSRLRLLHLRRFSRSCRRLGFRVLLAAAAAAVLIPLAECLRVCAHGMAYRKQKLHLAVKDIGQDTTGDSADSVRWSRRRHHVLTILSDRSCCIFSSLPARSETSPENVMESGHRRFFEIRHGT